MINTFNQKYIYIYFETESQWNTCSNVAVESVSAAMCMTRIWDTTGSNPGQKPSKSTDYFRGFLQNVRENAWTVVKVTKIWNNICSPPPQIKQTNMENCNPLTHL
jgi:hypothetical protein